MKNVEPLVDRHFLERLERLTLHWQKSFPGLVGGHNRSRFAGSGLEFLDHRNFHPGDDLRAVNWRAFMRLEKMFLKMFQVEPRVPVRVLIDISKSMTTGAHSKFLYARRVAAALCFVGLVKLDLITIQPFSDHLDHAFLCGGGRHRFMPAADFLSNLKPAGAGDFLKVAREFNHEYAQRGLLIIISDFLDDQDCLKPLQYLSDYGHELLLVHIWADEDRVPPWEGELALEDAETGANLELSFDPSARQQYTEAFDEYAAQVRRLALRNGGRYAGLPTSLPVEEAMFGPMVTAGGMA
ncbi:MAG TPA: DUF58 domain-containing protein [Bryobacteraceae bacterium]|jgi:uncharacterized protein (DUF58 family)